MILFLVKVQSFPPAKHTLPRSSGHTDVHVAGVGAANKMSVMRWFSIALKIKQTHGAGLPQSSAVVADTYKVWLAGYSRNFSVNTRKIGEKSSS